MRFSVVHWLTPSFGATLALSKEDKKLYLDWEKARKEKAFSKADQYRDQLIEKGILT